MNSSLCQHKNLVLLTKQDDRVRCRHCHLTIKRDELRTRYCPECYESTGVKREDLEAVAELAEARVHYRCEDCGILIEPQWPTL